LKISGQLRELKHQYENPIQYYIQIDQEKVHINPYVGNKIKLNFNGEINCIHCGRKIKKTYNSGSCYPCFKNLPQNDLCIVKPSLCHYDQGTCRDESFAEQYCMIPHYVYLALSSDVKVGLTRKTNELKRWVDQGAIKSIPIAELPNRKIAGDLELALAEHLPDKTNWRNMLKGDIVEKDILQARNDVRKLVPEQYQQYLLDEEGIYEFIYPLLEKLEKVKSLSFDKLPEIEGRLIGIKGQYLILDTGVLNMRKHSGYTVDIELGSD